jgi:uncharacterized protein (DUF1810 family)
VRPARRTLRDLATDAARAGPPSDPFDLERFVKAQAPAYDQVLSELRAGRKRSHWIWFIFPQLRGLGSSGMSRKYAISSLDEARAYLRHPTLGPRLLECVRLVNAVEGRSIEEILGADDVKLRSSLTLFGRADPDAAELSDALEEYFGGVPDQRTLDLL